MSRPSCASQNAPGDCAGGGGGGGTSTAGGAVTAPESDADTVLLYTMDGDTIAEQLQDSGPLGLNLSEFGSGDAVKSVIADGKKCLALPASRGLQSALDAALADNGPRTFIIGAFGLATPAYMFSLGGPSGATQYRGQIQYNTNLHGEYHTGGATEAVFANPNFRPDTFSPHLDCIFYTEEELSLNRWEQTINVNGMEVGNEIQDPSAQNTPATRRVMVGADTFTTFPTGNIIVGFIHVLDVILTPDEKLAYARARGVARG